MAKVNAVGAGLVYFTFLGATTYGSGAYVTVANNAQAIIADATGNAYVAGFTSDPSFPATPSAFQTKLAVANPGAGPQPFPDGFVAKLNPTGSAIVWATYLGGTAADQAQTIALDSAGDVWLSGITQSTDFPVSDGFPGGTDFLAEFNPSGSALLNAARYPSGSVSSTLAVDANGSAHAAGTFGVVSMFTPAQLAAPRIYGITNAAGGLLSGRVAPGELISIYGLHLGPSTPASGAFNQSGFLPATLGGVHFVFNDTAAPLLYVSDAQINAVVPLEVAPGTAAQLRLTVNDTSLPNFRVMVDGAQPEVFRGPGVNAAAINQDGTVNSQSNPAPLGSFVSVWATGVGFTQGVDGQMQTTPQALCGCVIHDGNAGKDAFLAYAGAAPGMVTGIVQINFQVSAAGGEYTLNANGRASDPFTVFVGQ